MSRILFDLCDKGGVGEVAEAGCWGWMFTVGVRMGHGQVGTVFGLCANLMGYWVVGVLLGVRNCVRVSS